MPIRLPVSNRLNTQFGKSGVLFELKNAMQWPLIDSISSQN
jgi:hypothetical protein